MHNLSMFKAETLVVRLHFYLSIYEYNIVKYTRNITYYRSFRIFHICGTYFTPGLFLYNDIYVLPYHVACLYIYFKTI